MNAPSPYSFCVYSHVNGVFFFFKFSIDNIFLFLQGTKKPFNPQIVCQLVWREFFYTMSVNNDYYDEMDRNQICINIPWSVNGDKKWA